MGIAEFILSTVEGLHPSTMLEPSKLSRKQGNPVIARLM